MAGLNVSKWQASRRKPFYSPVQQFYLRMIRVGLDEARAAKDIPCPYSQGWYPDGVSMEFGVEPGYGNGSHWSVWDRAVMARHWVARETPDRHADREGYILSFQHACEVLGLNADHEATWMLREIDGCADFDTEEVYARIEYLIANPPDEVEEAEFEGFRVVPKLDQGNLFAAVA